MKPEIKQRWLTALRSGEYDQGRAGLRATRRDGSKVFCCLGVLCDLAAKEGIGEWSARVFPDSSVAMDYHAFEVPGGSDMGYLPMAVQKWAGTISPNPVIEKKPLSFHNDGGASFKEIADLIEKHL